MKREILVFGIILLFVGLAIAPTIYANVDRVSLKDVYDRSSDRFELGSIVFKLFFNNMRLVFLLLFALSNPSEIYSRFVYNRCLDAFSSLDDNELDLLLDSVDLEYTEVKEKLSYILVNDLDFDSLLEENDCLDCGCNSDIMDFNWSFPVICNIVFIPFLFGLIIWKVFEFIPYSIISTIGWLITIDCRCISYDNNLNCFWDDWIDDEDLTFSNL